MRRSGTPRISPGAQTRPPSCAMPGLAPAGPSFVVVLQDDAGVVDMLAHQILGARAVAPDDGVDDAVVVIVRAQDDAVVFPQDDAVRRVGNGLGLRGEAPDPGIAGGFQDAVVQRDVHLLVRHVVVGSSTPCPGCGRLRPGNCAGSRPRRSTGRAWPPGDRPALPARPAPRRPPRSRRCHRPAPCSRAWAGVRAGPRCPASPGRRAPACATRPASASGISSRRAPG